MYGDRQLRPPCKGPKIVILLSNITLFFYIDFDIIDTLYIPGK